MRLCAENRNSTEAGRKCQDENPQMIGITTKDAKNTKKTQTAKTHNPQMTQIAQIT